jgi:hypothetical protein
MSIGPYDQSRYTFRFIDVLASARQEKEYAPWKIELLFSLRGDLGTRVFQPDQAFEKALTIDAYSRLLLMVDEVAAPGVPILRLSASGETHGMNTAWPFVSQFLLDFRRIPPGTIGALPALVRKAVVLA